MDKLKPKVVFDGFDTTIVSIPLQTNFLDAAIKFL